MKKIFRNILELILGFGFIALGVALFGVVTIIVSKIIDFVGSIIGHILTYTLPGVDVGTIVMIMLVIILLWFALPDIKVIGNSILDDFLNKIHKHKKKGSGK